jgi:hypothetical protein
VCKGLVGNCITPWLLLEYDVEMGLGDGLAPGRQALYEFGTLEKKGEKIEPLNVPREGSAAVHFSTTCRSRKPQPGGHER